MQAHVASRVLWFTTVKACINTVMVLTGWKKSGVFKATPKLGENPADLAPSGRLPDTANSGSESSPASGGKSDVKAEKSSGFGLHHVHDGLSKVLHTLHHPMHECRHPAVKQYARLEGTEFLYEGVT